MASIEFNAANVSREPLVFQYTTSTVSNPRHERGRDVVDVTCSACNHVTTLCATAAPTVVFGCRGCRRLMRSSGGES